MLSREQIISRHDAAWERQRGWAPVIEDAYRYAMPHREGDMRRPAGANPVELYDDTAVLSLPAGAGHLMMRATPPFQKWFEIEGGPAMPQKEREGFNAAMEPVTRAVQEVLHSGPSLSAFFEMYMDLFTGRGNLGIFPGDDTTPVVFTAVPRPSMAIENGAFGRVGGWFRNRTIHARLIDEEWSDAKLSTFLVEKGQQDGEAGDVTVQEVTWWDKSGQNYGYAVVCKDDKDGGLIVDRKYRRSPWITPRWEKMAGAHDGYGPLLKVLPTIRVVNKTVEMTLKNAALGLAGVYTAANDGVINPATVRLVPSAVIPVASNGGPRGPSLMPLQTGRDVNLSQIVLQEARENIRRGLMDTRLPDTREAVKSPTEIFERVKELNRDAGAGFGRLVDEGLVPAVQRTMDVMAEKGILDLPDGFAIDGLFSRVRVTSQLAQVQKVEEVERVINWLMTQQQMLGREAMMLGARVEDIPALLAEDMDVPSRYVRDEQSRRGLQQMIAQMIAQGQQEQLGQAGAVAGLDE